MTARSIRRATEREVLKAAHAAEHTAAEAFGGMHTGESFAHKPIPTAKQSAAVPPSRVVANRANAQLSTGPTSEAGKKKVSLNAVKTGLTGRTVLVAGDDTQAYAEHLVRFANEWQPANDGERALVQGVADHAWRLERVRSLEMTIYARGRLELQAECDVPQAAELETYLRYEKQLRNLHIQESRLRRYREKDTQELSRLQAERREKELAQRETAKLRASNPAMIETASVGFEFSTPEETAACGSQVARPTPGLLEHSACAVGSRPAETMHNAQPPAPRTAPVAAAWSTTATI